MPRAFYRVHAVDATRVRNNTTRYEVWLGPTNGQRCDLLVSTVNQWRAALCERAAETQMSVDLEWRETAYGRELVEVRLQEN